MSFQRKARKIRDQRRSQREATALAAFAQLFEQYLERCAGHQAAVIRFGYVTTADENRGTEIVIETFQPARVERAETLEQLCLALANFLDQIEPPSPIIQVARLEITDITH